MSEVQIKLTKCTKQQQDFLHILFNDLLYDRSNRNARLSHEFNREIRFLDELTLSEASKMIQILKEMKENVQTQHTID